MAYAAELDDNNVVLRVLKLDDADCTDDATATSFCNNLFGTTNQWKKLLTILFMEFTIIQIL